MIVLVCGGRWYGRIDPEATDRAADVARVTEERLALAVMLRDLKPSKVIHGGAPGADRAADAWALESGVPVETYPADWRKHGRAAGPIRNAAMLRLGKPDVVVACPGGRGTAGAMNDESIKAKAKKGAK